ncbi:hypothetical protein KC329_g89 [Hortaea werneckii]|nr:hypothetical protein KC329_g89 [Hortaea werneckii]
MIGRLTKSLASVCIGSVQFAMGLAGVYCMLATASWTDKDAMISLCTVRFYGIDACGSISNALWSTFGLCCFVSPQAGDDLGRA